MKALIRSSAVSFIVVLLAMLWTSSAFAFGGFDDGGGAGVLACAVCHADLADRGPDHDTHSELSNDDCGSCHGSGGRDDPPLDNCMRCHGRDADGSPSADFTAGLGRGLRQHHVTVGAAACGNCHSDTVNATTGSAPENVLPSFYPQALGGAGLDPCDGSEENFASNSISLDNDGDGLTDSADPDCAGNAAPVADPNGPYSAEVGVNISFDGTGSTDDGTIVEYEWDFGDGTALGMGATPTHTYGAAGTYTVTLTVTDDGGLTDAGTTTATITDVPPPNQAPTADPNGPYNAQVGDTINFSGAGSSDPDGTIVAYDWDFGDGSTGTGANPTHAYSAAGTFTVTLTVTDDGGLTDAGTTTATVTDVPPPNQAPTANANGPYNAQVGDTINFSGAGSSDPDGSIVAYDWDFGDGSTGTGANPTHAYSAAGTLTVTLTVTDDGSPALTDSAITTATITDTPPPNQAPTADPNGPYNAQAGDTVNFNGSGSSDPDGTIVAYDWDFGDGSIGTGANPTHTYGAAGTFTVTLTVTDDGSPALTGTAITTATITDAPPPNQAPTADPNGPYNAQVGDPVTFDGSASSDPDGSIVAYAWDFGDGNTGTGANPSYTYGAAGAYTVTLTVTDDGSPALTGTGTTSATIEEPPTSGDGETLYNAWCLGCHGDFDQPNQASSIKVLGARSCSIDAAIDGNPAAGTDTPYPDGVPDMQFMQGVLTGPSVDAISGWMNASPVSAVERYTTACSGCHGADGSGGFVTGDIRGQGGNVEQAISNVDAMQFLSCLPESDLTAFGDFLGREVEIRSGGGGSGSTGPIFLALFGWAVYLVRRRRLAG